MGLQIRKNLNLSIYETFCEFACLLQAVQTKLTLQSNLL